NGDPLPYIDSPTFTNSPTGTVEANGATLFIGSDSSGNDMTNSVPNQWTNAGKFIAINGGKICLSGAYSTADIGNTQIDSTSTIQIGGTLNNAGATLGFSSAGEVDLGA